MHAVGVRYKVCVWLKGGTTLQKVWYCRLRLTV